jgi:hypothetical protein
VVFTVSPFNWRASKIRLMPLEVRCYLIYSLNFKCSGFTAAIVNFLFLIIPSRYHIILIEVAHL